MSYFTFEGASGNDEISSYELFLQYPQYDGFRLNGNDGDDNLSLSIMGRMGFDQANGGRGNDFMSGSAYMTDYASMLFAGGEGTDEVYFPGGTITDIKRVDSTLTEVTVVDSNDGSKLTAVISDDVEIVSYGEVAYLTEDIAKGRVRPVEFDEIWFRAHNDNADWYVKGLDTYAAYHYPSEPTPVTPIPVAPSPEPTPVTPIPVAPSPEPTPEPTPVPPAPEKPQVEDEIIGINKVVGSRKKDRLNGTRGADEILGYGGNDIINGKNGDDLIDPGAWTTGKFDNVKGGNGSDTFVVKDGYWAFIKDFNVVEDKLEITGLSQGLEWEIKGRKTYIYGDDGNEVARLKGKVDLAEANLL